MKFSIVGCGTLGRIILAALLKVHPDCRIIASVRSKESATALCQWLSLRYTGTLNTPHYSQISVLCVLTTQEDLKTAYGSSDVVFLTVKPSQLSSIVLGKYRKPNPSTPITLPNANDDIGPFVISVIAGTTFTFLESSSNICHYSRCVCFAMPNTACEVSCGMTSLFFSRCVCDSQRNFCYQLFSAVGRYVELHDESLISAATAIAGCGPAYVYMMIEAISDAGVKMGLPRDVSRTLAAQTLCGGGEMVLSSNLHPAQLRDMVTTAGGCTIAGVAALEEGGLRGLLIKGIIAASDRALEMTRENILFRTTARKTD